jgi:flagellar biosynthesis/type III secretory pathway chaperone
MSALPSAIIDSTMREFAKSLREALYVYTQLFTLCERERRIIEEDDYVGLREILGQKQTLLNAVVPAEEKMTALKSEWLECKNVVDAVVREEIVSILKEFSSLMEKLVILQKDNEKIMIEHTAKKAEELTLVRTGKKLNQVYSLYGDIPAQANVMDKRK